MTEISSPDHALEENTFYFIPFNMCELVQVPKLHVIFITEVRVSLTDVRNEIDQAISIFFEGLAMFFNAIHIKDVV